MNALKLPKTPLDYSLAEAAKILNSTESALLQYAAFQVPPFDGLRLTVHIVDEVLDANGEHKGRYSIHCLLDPIEIANVIANGEIEISSVELLARTKGVIAKTMDDELLHRLPVDGGGWAHEYHSKNDTVTISQNRIVIDDKHLIEFQQKIEALQLKQDMDGDEECALENKKCESLQKLIQPHIEKSFSELPPFVAAFVEKRFSGVLIDSQLDELTLEQRLSRDSLRGYSEVALRWNESTPEQRNRTAKVTDESAVTQSRYACEAREKQKAGRYTLKATANELAEKTGWSEERWLGLIAEHVNNSGLPLKNPRDWTDPLPYPVTKTIRNSYDEVSKDDVNKWLRRHPEWGTHFCLGNADAMFVTSQAGRGEGQIKHESLIVQIAGRDALPVRAIPYVAGWRNMSPDYVAKLLARHFNDESWAGLRDTFSYHLQSGVPVRMLPKEWDLIVAILAGLSADLRSKFPHYDQGYAAWQNEAVLKLPAGVFVWRDEFEKDFQENFSPEALSFTEERTGDRDLIYTPMLSDDVRTIVFDGFISRHVHDVLPVVEQLSQEDNARALAKVQTAYDETGLNGTAINWRYWVHQMPVLTAAQAARLMSGLEPDLFDDLNNRPGKGDPTREIQKEIKIQRLAEGQGKLTASPAEWMEWASAFKWNVHVGFRIAVEDMQEVAKAAICEERNKGEPKAPPVSPAAALRETWIDKSVKLANEIGLRKFNSGERQITARKICDAVATELAKGEPGKPQMYHGNQGPRAAGAIRSVALKGWKFDYPSGTHGINGTDEIAQENMPK